ncbi:MAPEG family protein [Gammaproteobacteria bacterium]|nr:MAPEG family protein [Gammaproteobacteria bacterium]MDA9321341.1 MAPEG family protein [Gammaproteobacteria bacterium]MDB4157227.1 MAPEG family protein [Gammaproteobacteria bacterium]MDC0005507.1 MAPEG family protein [Gammaproteobacteria bacterium]
MIDLIICVGMFYILHLFFKMSFSLHKVPFVQWTYTDGDTSNLTALSSRMVLASNNLRQSLPVFFVFAVLSVIQDVDNLMLAQTWFGLRVAYLLGAVLDLYRFKMVRPVIWLPSVIVLVCMGCNLYS